MSSRTPRDYTAASAVAGHRREAVLERADLAGATELELEVDADLAGADRRIDVQEDLADAGAGGAGEDVHRMRLDQQEQLVGHAGGTWGEPAVGLRGHQRLPRR